MPSCPRKKYELLNQGSCAAPLPPSLGGKERKTTAQSPPRLGDLGGAIISNSNRNDLCVHDSQFWRKREKLHLNVPQNWGI